MARMAEAFAKGAFAMKGLAKPTAPLNLAGAEVLL
jgi:hypothetical protein